MNEKEIILVPSTSDIKMKATLQEVAKILTLTEGTTTSDKVEEIFQLMFSIEKVRSGLNNFFRTGTGKIEDILTEWVEATGLADVLTIEHRKVNWCFCVRAARVPHEVYSQHTPEQNTNLAGTATGMRLGKQLHFMYGDSRVYSGPSNTGDKYKNIAYIFAYKEVVGKYS